MLKSPTKREIEFAGKTLSLETGNLAFQANMAVLARYGETVVLATAVCNEPQIETDFFPLRVDFEERLYAGGYIKSSRFIKREGRPSDEAIITGRLIDHAIRPRFPKDFMNDVQVVVTPLSVEQEGDVETLALVAASAVLHSSDIPWKGPLATVRVGINKAGEFVLNPGESTFNDLELNIVLTVGREGRIAAMEMAANQVPEKKVLEAFEFGVKSAEPLLDFIDEFATACNSTKLTYVSRGVNPDAYKAVSETALDKVIQLIRSPFIDREDQTLALEEEVFAKFEGKYTKVDMKKALFQLEKEATRRLILEKGERPDGRKFDEIRPLSMAVSVLPRTHGSALFSRGLTQSLTITTLGSMSLEQTIQGMYGEDTKRYMHHYNGPAFSLGEISRGGGGAGRREVGHGMLAEKALKPVIPSKEVFPYAIRVVSEILSQQGSSSMAATAASTLSLMDAGVPITSPVAGIAIGLMTDEDESKYVLLTDIANFEDFYGFMDFKMAGTREGVTAIQMDIKFSGPTLKQLEEAMAQSRKARLEILDQMAELISVPRTELSKHAPRITTLKIKTDQIGLLIGPGGKTIRDIIARTGATIDVEEDGSVFVAAVDAKGGEQAVQEIMALTHEVAVGEIYDGTIKRVMEFGVFVEITPSKEGLVHVSELAYEYTPSVDAVAKVGDKIKVKVVGIGDDGKISLSKKALEPKPEGYVERERPERSSRPQMRRGGFGGNRFGASRPPAPRGRPARSPFAAV